MQNKVILLLAFLSIFVNAQHVIFSDVAHCLSAAGINFQARDKVAYLPAFFDLAEDPISSCVVLRDVESIPLFAGRGVNSAILEKASAAENGSVAYILRLYSDILCKQPSSNPAAPPSLSSIPVVRAFDEQRNESHYSDCAQQPVLGGVYVGVVDDSTFGQLNAYTSDKCTKFQNYKSELANVFTCAPILRSGQLKPVAYFYSSFFPPSAPGLPVVGVRLYSADNCEEEPPVGAPSIPSPPQIPVASPVEEEGSVVSPNEEEGSVVSPNEEEGLVVSPNEEEGSVVSPNEEEGSIAPPVEESPAASRAGDSELPENLAADVCINYSPSILPGAHSIYIALSTAHIFYPLTAGLALVSTALVFAS